MHFPKAGEIKYLFFFLSAQWRQWNVNFHSKPPSFCSSSPNLQLQDLNVDSETFPFSFSKTNFLMKKCWISLSQCEKPFHGAWRFNSECLLSSNLSGALRFWLWEGFDLSCSAPTLGHLHRWRERGTSRHLGAVTFSQIRRRPEPQLHESL